ncbi:hypothetical protein [Streptomyces sp. NPDC058739]|uniref:hypothetical protein n=1 Tax=Streptomyces sp. NPDC058739 TaxID=3346618 RepID=UPI0036C0DC62
MDTQLKAVTPAPERSAIPQPAYPVGAGPAVPAPAPAGPAAPQDADEHRDQEQPGERRRWWSRRG